MVWVREPNLVLRHFTGAAWTPEVALGEGSYPNLKLGTGDGLVEWVATEGGCPPVRRNYGSWMVGANQRPVASFSYGCSGLACSFDAAESVDLDGTLSSYAWDFGDGSTGSGVVAVHTYGAAGDYTVVLTVIDDEGASDLQSQEARIGYVGYLPLVLRGVP
jgi:PKD repeat protein